MFQKLFITSSLSLLCLSLANAEEQLKLAGIFNNNMVLQRNSEVAIWGKGKANSDVVVKSSWNRKPTEVKVAADGKWKAMIATPKAGSDYGLTVSSGSSKIQLKNIASGEVWLCSGQSNMQWKMRGFGLDHFKEDVMKANKPKIRLCTVKQTLGLKEQDDLNASWQVCSSKNVLNFSAVAYFFGSRLHDELDVPIGLISSSWGGSAIKGWMSSDLLKKEMANYAQETAKYSEWEKESETFLNKTKPKGLSPSSPSVLYNAMLKPLIPFGIRGVIWYQGEADVGDPELYSKHFPLMIKDWRTQWGKEDFPFYYVQIAPWKYKYLSFSTAYLRESQLHALAVPNTGMVVTMDLGDLENIHPKRKKPVGERLALLALAKDYGKSTLVFSGPLFKDSKVKGKSIELSFDHLGGGLVTRDGFELSHFTIAAKNKKFYPAQANIKNDKIIVTSDEVRNPVAVRFGWGSADEPNLMNKEGLPASSFRTDDWDRDNIASP